MTATFHAFPACPLLTRSQEQASGPIYASGADRDPGTCIRAFMQILDPLGFIHRLSPSCRYMRTDVLMVRLQRSWS